MKKIFVMAVMAAATLTASAQYTPKAGTFGTQITFRPFGSASDTKSTFALDDAGIVGRYFFTDKSAVRVGFDFGWQDTTEPQFTNNWNNNKKEKSGENVTSSTKWGINVGYEYYFANYNRLNLYAGGQVGVDMVNNKTKFDS
ncbi:MAG: hypothetical protein II055_04250, partial [Prevotella sp.]|nr:hypothetical protein [Prevotella sp.]